ncbi:MAG: hypothetical protein FWC27_02170, partial [Firmicutes bacterium]|nr:hypothetical protein [Bacillota bacterium]
ALLLLAGFLLAAGAGLLPLLLDFAADRAAASIPSRTPSIDMGLRWAKAGGAVLLALLAALLCAPLRVGREAWFYGGADGRNRSSARVTFWLQPRWALKAARFVLVISCAKLLWAALYLLPGGFLLAGTLWQMRAGDLSMGLFLSAVAGGAALLTLGAFFYGATAQRYALVLPVLAKQPRCKLRNALRLSAARTDGNCAALLRFRLSFLPWYALSLPVIPLLFTAPYIAQCLACRHAELLNGGVE